MKKKTVRKNENLLPDEKLVDVTGGSADAKELTAKMPVGSSAIVLFDEEDNAKQK